MRNKSALMRPAGTCEIGCATDTGKVRRHNEDSVFTQEFALSGGILPVSGGFYAVADGVGGCESGELASNMALRLIAASLTRLLLTSPALSRDYLRKILKKSIAAANKKIYDAASNRDNGMATTLAAVLVVDGTACIANVGDSRVYAFDGEKLAPITADHSVVAAMVRAGEIAPEDIYTHPRRNIITRCLGMDSGVAVDIFEKPVLKGESLVICSDGLWEMVRDNEIAAIIRAAETPQTASRRLVAAANENGGHDNISVIIIKFI